MRHCALALVVVMSLAGCRTPREAHPADRGSAAPVQPTALTYADADGFDGLFEASLINRDPVIIVHTGSEKPDWPGRLNAWIAAWNQGGKGERRIVRGQIPVPSIDGDALRELRLLIFGVIDRAEDVAKAGTTWWRDERMRSRRVDLLRPYNLRFHVNEACQLDLIFFHGDYAAQYPDFIAKLTGGTAQGWTRTVECSACQRYHEEARARRGAPGGE